jgi:topoisomerase IA-like protein
VGVLESYGWVDKDKGVVRIPIEEAMRLIAERGLPPTPPAEVAADKGKPGAASATAKGAPTKPAVASAAAKEARR